MITSISYANPKRACQSYFLQARAYLLRKLSSEKAFDRRLTLDLPLSTFQDAGDAAGDADT